MGEDSTVKMWLAAQEIAVHDYQELFHMLAGDDDVITAEDMVVGVGNLKGLARAVELRKLQQLQESSVAKLEALQASFAEHRTKLTASSDLFEGAAAQNLHMLESLSNAMNALEQRLEHPSIDAAL